MTAASPTHTRADSTHSQAWAGVKEISDLEPAVLKQIEDFFVNYQKVRDIEFRILGREGSHSARQMLEAASQHHIRGRRKAS
jgi:inorganic pyrophosphatase